MITQRRHKFALAKQRKLLKAALQIAIELGAKRDEGTAWCRPFHEYTLTTKAGQLGMTFSEGNALASIFCAFEEPKAALCLFEEMGRAAEVNPFSGKWNFHVGRSDHAESFLVLFRSNLEKIV